MAKLTDRQRNNILAKWDTGIYTKTQLAKAYKVDEKVIRAIVGKEKPKNSDIVEAQTIIETIKKSEKSPIEIQAINQAVKCNLESAEYKQKNIETIHEVAHDILKGLHGLIKGGKAQKVITTNLGDGVIESNIVEYDLQPNHYKEAIETVDKASLTLKVNERHAPKQDINLTNAQQNITLEIE